MPSVYFEDFQTLWAKVESKFTDENNGAFTLDDLYKHFISQNLISPLTSFASFASIEEKFLKHRDSAEKPKNVNLSGTTLNSLYQYLGIRGISELRGNTYIDSENVTQKIKQESERTDKSRFHSPQSNFSEIGFLGRQNEISELENFLQSPESRIFALNGVPLIGKTKLVKHFLEISEIAKAYRIITVKLNPNPDDAGQRIKTEVFGDKDFNDFSEFFFQYRNRHTEL